MPQYKSLDVTATLSVTPLADTLTEEIGYRMGEDQKRDADRVTYLLMGGRKLPERPIGADGISKVGIMQFVGENGDMAVFMAEAGDGLTAETTAAASSLPMLDSSEGAALTNIAAPGLDIFRNALEARATTPTTDNLSDLDEPTDNAKLKKKKRTPKSVHHDTIFTPNKQKQVSTFGRPSEPPSTPAPTWDAFAAKRKPLALTLNLQYSGRTFLRKDRELLGTGKDLKIEILMNGQLVEVQYRSARKSAAEAMTDVFSGTRLHRQFEVPWVYNQKTSSSFLDSKAAQQRWVSINHGLMQEAHARGVDKSLQQPLTGEYLTALSRIALPQRIEAKGANYGIIDIVITAGKGRKYGPETVYLKVPTRMENKQFTATAAVLDLAPTLQPQQDDMFMLQQQDDDLSMLYSDPMFDLPSVPYFTQPSATNAEAEDTLVETPERPKMKRASDVYRKVLRTTPFKQKIGAYGNARGGPMVERSLRQRLGDMIKMSPAKQREAYRELETKLDEGALSDVRRALEMEEYEPTLMTPTKNVEIQLEPRLPDLNALTAEPFETMEDEPMNPPTKRTGFEPEPEPSIFDMFTTEAGDMVEDEPADDSPFKKVRFDLEPPVLGPYATEEGVNVFNGANIITERSIDPELLQLSPTFVDPAAMLTQDRMDMALDYGLSSHSALLNHMVATSPLRDSLRRTPASSLSGAPIDVPVKKRPYMRRAQIDEPEREITPEPSTEGESHAPSPKRAVRAKTAPQRAAAGANRNGRRWNPNEEKPEAVLERFEIPDLCVGSAVTYALPGSKRQIKKERNGEFEEEVFIVGMRYVVL